MTQNDSLRLHTLAVALVCFCALTGCGIPRRLSDEEKSTYSAFARADVVVEKKSPGAAVGLGFAPFALGAFYSDQWVVFGAVDFLLWPLSIVWAPVNSYARVRETNYRATVEALGPEKIRQIAELDRQRAAGAITDAQYVDRARAIAGFQTHNPRNQR